MTTFLHIKTREGEGFLMVREGAFHPPRLVVTTGLQGARLNREEAESLKRTVERWLRSQGEKEVEP